VLNIIIAGTDSNITNAIEDALKSSISDIKTSVINLDDKISCFINKNHQYDALIINFQLNDTTPLKFIKQIREYSDMPILVVSDNNNIKFLIKYLDAGADSFINTPFNKNIFAASLKALIRRVNWDIYTN
jgi:DNA-binding response OmpR family regulator